MFSTDHLNLKLIQQRTTHTLNNNSRQSGFVLAAKHNLCKDINEHIQKIYERITPMAKRKGKNDYGFQFLNITLSKQEVDAFKNAFNSNELDTGTIIHELLLDGGKISVNYNQERQVFFATLLFPEGSGMNSGLGFSSYAAEPVMAIALTAYKYLEILQRDLRSEVDNDAFGDLG